MGRFLTTYAHISALHYIIVVKKKSLSVLGLHKNKLTASLIINIVAGASLLAMFISRSTENIVFDLNSFYAITYISVAGIFEMEACSYLLIW